MLAPRGVGVPCRSSLFSATALSGPVAFFLEAPVPFSVFHDFSWTPRPPFPDISLPTPLLLRMVLTLPNWTPGSGWPTGSLRPSASMPDGRGLWFSAFSPAVLVLRRLGAFLPCAPHRNYLRVPGSFLASFPSLLRSFFFVPSQDGRRPRSLFPSCAGLRTPVGPLISAQALFDPCKIEPSRPPQKTLAMLDLCGRACCPPRGLAVSFQQALLPHHRCPPAFFSSAVLTGLHAKSPAFPVRSAPTRGPLLKPSPVCWPGPSFPPLQGRAHHHPQRRLVRKIGRVFSPAAFESIAGQVPYPAGSGPCFFPQLVFNTVSTRHGALPGTRAFFKQAPRAPHLDSAPPGACFRFFGCGLAQLFPPARYCCRVSACP